MKVLITGGAGFIGSHLAAHLRAAGDEPVALDNLSVGRRENLPPEVKLIVADILDVSLKDTVAAGQFDAIVHLAGQTMVNATGQYRCWKQRVRAASGGSFLPRQLPLTETCGKASFPLENPGPWHRCPFTA